MDMTYAQWTRTAAGRKAEAAAEAHIQSNPEFGASFLTMPIDQLRALVTAQVGHPSLLRKAERILAARVEAL